MISWNYSRTAIELTIKRNSSYHSYSPKWRIGKEESIQKASISTFSFLHCSTLKRIKYKKKKIRTHQLRATKNRLQIWLWVNELNASCVLSLLHHLQLNILRIYCCCFPLYFIYSCYFLFITGSRSWTTLTKWSVDWFCWTCVI